MKNMKDLNWLSAPAFFLILGMIAFHVKKNMDPAGHRDEVRREAAVINRVK